MSCVPTRRGLAQAFDCSSFGSLVNAGLYMLQEDEIKNLLRIHYRRLQKLEEKRAMFGELHTPSHILIEIEDEKSEIEELEKKLNHLLSMESDANELQDATREQPTDTFEPIYKYEAAASIRRLVKENSPFKLNKTDYFLLEWVIGAALDNGLFEPSELQKKISVKDIDFETVSVAFQELLRSGVFRSPQIGLAYLSDIDDVVIPRLKARYALKGEVNLIRSNLKELAQGKALRGMWNVTPDGILYLAPKRNPEGMELDTIRVIEEMLTLKAVSEYGTWMRRTPFQEKIQDLLSRDGNIQVILTLPPPSDSEGYNEWCDSVQILRDWHADIYLADSDKQNLHFTLGRSGAISIKRQRTQNRLELAYVHHQLDLEKLHSKFTEYLSAPSTISLDNWLEENRLIIRCAGFNILARGPWTKATLRPDYSKIFQAEITEQTARVIDEKWTNVKQIAETSGQKLFSGDLVRLKGFSESTNSLALKLGPTTYKDYVGTHLQLDQISRIVGDEHLSGYLANPLATCAVIVSGDNKILIGKRSMKTVDYPGYFHVPGGHIELRHVQRKNIDLSLAIRDELYEEFAIRNSDIKNLICTGLAEDSISKKPELTFMAQMKVNHESILPVTEEHTEAIWLEATPESVTDFLIRNNFEIVPVGKACLMLFGAAIFGYEWFITVNDRMREDWRR